MSIPHAASRFCIMALCCFNAVVLSFAQTKAASRPVMVTAPACPVGLTEHSTKELLIDYFPSREGAAITNVQSLTLRLVFNNPGWRDNNRTIAFQHEDDGSWRAVVPLLAQWDYAIWYVRDDQTGRHHDNHGQYWDVVFCDANGRKLTDGIRDQADGYAGAIFADDLRRTPDYDRAIATIENSHLDQFDSLLYDEWVFKFRRQADQKHAGQELVREIEAGLAQHSADSYYLRRTAEFLIRWQEAFPTELVERAIDISDRHALSGPTLRSELERERAEAIEDRRERVKALDAWLAKYPDDAFYSNQLRKERLDLFGELGQVSDAESVFRELQSRVPQEPDLYATMASIYIRRKTKLARALMLLDKADRNINAPEMSQSHYVVILVEESPNENKAILNYWRGKAYSEEGQWTQAERFLQEAAPVMDEAVVYAFLGQVQQRRNELEKAKGSYLQASVRSSEHEEEYVGRYVMLSLKTGTPSREAAMQELDGARKRNLNDAHYKPALVDLPVPNFSFATTTGEKITASSIRGQTVLLDIWSTWCAPCVSELGGFENVRQAHPELRVLLVAIDSKLPDVKKVLRRQRISTKEIILDDEDSVASFGLNGVPQTYLIDKNGRIRIMHLGGLPDVVSYLEADLASIRSTEN